MSDTENRLGITYEQADIPNPLYNQSGTSILTINGVNVPLQPSGTYVPPVLTYFFKCSLCSAVVRTPTDHSAWHEGLIQMVDDMIDEAFDA